MYEISFVKQITVSDPDLYINDCCWGGDVVRDELMPLVRANGYDSIETHQEDWGWFIWFRRGAIHLAIDIGCDDFKDGRFRVLLSSHTKKMFFIRVESDTPELEELKDLVITRLEAWASSVQCQKTK